MHTHVINIFGRTEHALLILSKLKGESKLGKVFTIGILIPGRMRQEDHEFKVNLST